MNVVEAYIKFKGQLIILVSGLPGCGKTILSKRIARDFKLTHLEESSFYKQDYDTKTTLQDNTELINLYTDDAIDWPKLNQALETNKLGVVLSGISLSVDKIIVKPDYHISLVISKQKCIEKRHNYLTEHQTEYPEEFALIGSIQEKLKLNQLILPYYFESREKSKIDLTIQGTELTDSQIYDQAFDSLIKFIENYLYHEKPKQQDRSIINLNSSSSSSSSSIHDGPIVFLSSPSDAKFWVEYEDQKHGL